VAGDERPFLRDIEKLTRQTIRMAELPEGFAAPSAPAAAEAPARTKRHRPSRGPKPGAGQSPRPASAPRRRRSGGHG